MSVFPRGFWLATIASGLYFYAVQITFPLIPIFITDELDASASLVGLATLIPAIVALLLRIPAGSWSDQYGRRGFMLGGALMGIAFPVSTALSYNVPVFILSRIIFGLGLAFFTTANKAYIADIVPVDRMGEAFGINTSAFSLALILGPLTGEAMKGEFGFRPAFWVGAVLAVSAFVITYFIEPEPPHSSVGRSMRGDLGQVVHLKGAWASIFTSLSGAGIFAMIFVFFPLIVDELDFRAEAPKFMQNIIVSVAFSLFAIITFLGLPRAGRFSDKRGRAITLVPGIIVSLPGVVFLSQAKHIWVAYAAIGVLAIGFCSIRSMMDALMQDATPRALRGTGAALLFSSWDFAIGVQSQLLGMAIDMSGYRLMYIIVGASVVVFGGVAIWLSYGSERDRITTYKGEFPPIPTA